MFSPISVGAYLIQRIAGTAEDEEGAEGAKREDSAERNSQSSGSDSDEGTSADTHGPGVPVNRALTLEEIDCPIIESEIISSDTATEEYFIKQDEFAGRLAVLPAADIVVDDKMTSPEDHVQDYMADRGGLAKDFHRTEDITPQDINTHKLHLSDNRDDERPPQSGLREIDTTRDKPSHIPLPDGQPLNQFSETAAYEQSELHIDSDPDSGSDSSTTSGETMSTVKENTESRDFEDPTDVSEYNEKNNELFPKPAEDHVYIAPDLEFPFHKSTLQLKESVDLKDILENMDKKSASEPQKLKEARHIPKPISDEELENALKILRSGRPPAQRSWYSLDNISNTKPNRTFALYYSKAEAGRRRNSAGDEDDCISLPEKNSILGFPERPDEHSALYYVDDQWKFDELHIPDTPSEEEFALPGSTNIPETVGTHDQPPELPLKMTLKSDEQEQPLPLSEVYKKTVHESGQERPQNPHISQLSDKKTIPKTTMKSSPVTYPTPSPETSVGSSETSLDARLLKVTHGSVHPVRAAVYPTAERPTLVVHPRADNDPVDPKQEIASSVSDESPKSPQPYIAAVKKYPETFHPPISPKHKISKHNIAETEQYPVLSMKQKEIEFAEIENILPEKKKYPPLPPKPSFLKRKVEKENPIVPSVITREESSVAQSAFESKTTDSTNQNKSTEPYISASVKHPSVFTLPSMGTPISMKVQPTYRGKVIVDEQFPVISTAQKELVLSELENLVPKRKVPPKVPPKPTLRKRVEVDQQPVISTKVQTVESSVDLSILEKPEASQETLPQQVPQTVTAHHAGEENTNEDEVVILQAGISVYRQKPQEDHVCPTSGRKKLTRSHTLQIQDSGEVSFVPAPEHEHKHQAKPLLRSKSVAVTRMNASLSLHRLESGEHLTETILSVHEQEIDDANEPNTESGNEDSTMVLSCIDEDKEDLDRMMDSERDGSRSGTEDSYQSSDSFPLRTESFPASKNPYVASVSDHFGSSSCSSPDEFLTVADITISKMEAAKNEHRLEDASSTSSDSDSSGSVDSDDSSFESAEEHTYVVTECDEDVFDSHYEEGHRSSLPQVIEEADEEEEEEEENGNSSDEEENGAREIKQEIKTDLPEEDTHKNGRQREEENIPNKMDRRVSPTLQKEQTVELTETTNLDNIPVAEVQRYPRYISMGNPDIKPNTEYALSKTVDRESPYEPSRMYQNDSVTETALSDEKNSSESDEHQNEPEFGENTYDEPEHSEEMEEDFSEEYSDEPEWQPPPPSSGARVFVLTANMFRPARVEPQTQETRDVKVISDVPQEETGNAVRDTAYGRDVKYIDDKEYRDYEEELQKMVDSNHHELEPDKYFKPISEFIPSSSESTVQEKHKLAPVYNDPNLTSENISQPGEPNNKPQDVNTVTVTYTVIHTRKTPTTDDIPSSPSEPRYENLLVKNKDIDESTPQLGTYNETNSISAGTQQFKGTLESTKPDENEPNNFNVETLSNDNVSQDARTDNHLKSSKSIPVHEVGPYNYTSSEPKESEPGNRETIVRKTELNSGVSVFSVSSREHAPQRQRLAQPYDGAEHRDSGSYRFGSWYEESTENVPAMAIALVKRDIKLPSDHIPVRETVVKPEPKPEPNVEPVVVNTEPTSPERFEEGPYRFSAWYEEPTEEQEASTDDVVIISSHSANDPKSPKKETPLSPVREPGSYTFSSWYEEPVEKPSEDNFFVLSTPIASDEKYDSDTCKSKKEEKKKSSDDTRSRQRYRPSELYDAQPENIEEPPEEDTFVISKPFTETSSKPKSNTSEAKMSDSREMQYEAQYRFSTWYEDQPASNEPSDTFTISRPTEQETRDLNDSSASSSTRDSRESQLQYLYSTWSESTSPKEQPETFTISRPEEDTRPLTSGDDLYYPRETTPGIGLLVTDPTGRKLSAGDSVSATSSRKNSNSSSRTSGSLADVSATSGEAMRRTWSDDSENVSGDDSHGAGRQNFTPVPAPAGRMHATQPPQPKPRLSKPSAPSSSDDEQHRKPRRQGRGEGKGQETSRNADVTLTPKAEYALASSAWRQIPVGGSYQPTSESVIWDSGDDNRMTRTRDRGDRNSRYSVTDKSRLEIESMLDSLVPDDEFQEDTSSVSHNIRSDYSVPPAQTITMHGPTSQGRQDSARGYDVLPQAVNAQPSFQQTRSHVTSEPPTVGANAGMGQVPDFPEPILAARPQRDEPATTVYPSNRHERQVAPEEVRDAAPLSSRDEYKLAAASWENLSNTSDNETSRVKMKTWDNDPDAIRDRQKLHSEPLAGHQRFQSAEPAPYLPEEESVPPLGPKRNGLMITADIHAPYALKPEPGIPNLAVHMLSASSSTAELAPPPPDWGTPRKAHSAVGINQPPPQKKPVSKSVIPDAEAVIHRHRQRPPAKGLRPPSSRPGRPSSPVSVSSYSSTQSLPARILPRLPRDNELEKLKHQLALISKQIEIKTGELKQINLLNPSIKYHIPIRGSRGELISPDGRILSTPEAPNRRELDKYKKFFDRLPEPDFRRLMHEILVFKNKVRHKEEEIRRLTNQCTGLRKRLLWLAQHEK